MAKDKPPGASNGRSRRQPDHDDEIKIEKNGTISCWEGGRSHHLRRPTVGQLRDFVESFNQLKEDDAAAKEAADASEAAKVTALLEHSEWSDEDLVSYDRETFEHRWFDWWRDVFEQLDRDGTELPADDKDMQPWMLNGPMVTEVFRVWRSVPWAGGASPSETEAAAAADLAQKMGPTLAAAGPLLSGLRSPQS